MLSLLVAATLVLADKGEPFSGEHPVQGGGAPKQYGSRPEADFLTKEYLEELLKELEYNPVWEDERAAFVVTNKEGGEKKIYAQWSDMNSLKLVSAWSSPQTEYRDGPIVNMWNNQRQFTKVSIADDPDNADGSLLIMHMDQLVDTENKVGIKLVVMRSVATFKKSVFEFDDFVKDTYTQWNEAIQAKAKEQEKEETMDEA